MTQRIRSFEEMQQLAAECARLYGPAGADDATGSYFGIRQEEWEVFKFLAAAANLTLGKRRRLGSPKRMEIDDLAFGFLQARRIGRLAGAEDITNEIESGEHRFYTLRPEVHRSKSPGVLPE